MDFPRILRRLSTFFGQENCRYALIGGFGLHAYGLSRATADLDFAIEATCQDRLIAFLEDLGYETLHRSSGYSNHTHPEAAMGRIDFVYVDAGTAAVLFGHAQKQLVFADLAVPVPRPEHLIAMKLAAMKNDETRTFQELADLQYLIGLPDLDHALIQGFFKKYGFLEYYEELKRKISHR